MGEKLLGRHVGCRMRTGILCALTLFAAWTSQAFEWQVGAANKRVIPDAPELRFPAGFKATVKFACDLGKIGRSRHANLFTKGHDFHDGYSVMIRDDGKILVDIKGISPQYYVCTDIKIESGRNYTLEVYVTPHAVRLFLDGVEKGSYPFAGKLGYADVTAPLKLGTMGGYAFFGKLDWVRLEPLSKVTLPPGGPSPLVEKAPEHQPLADILWTKPICVEKGRYIGWATAVLTRKGTIVAAFSGDRDAHVCPFGKNQVVRSEDGGETWSAPITINNSIADDRDCGLVELPDGELLCIWFTDHTWDQIDGFNTKKYKPTSREYQWKRHVAKLPPERVKAACGIWSARSRDDGRTWSKPEKMAHPPAFSPHGPIVLKDGSLLWMGRTGYREKEKQGLTRVACARSTDGGRTWQETCYALPDQNGENAVKAMFHEPHAIELKDGRILTLIRYHGDDNCMRQAFSSDGGHTFTPMTKTPMLGLPPHLLRLQDGRILCTFGRRFPQPVGFGEYAALSSDEGATWDSREIFLSAHVDGDLGYPTTVQLKNGDLVTVYYQPIKGGEPPCLMATKWRVKPSAPVRATALLIHPDELSEAWIARAKQLNLTTFAIHPCGGKAAYQSLDDLLARCRTPEFRRLVDQAYTAGLKVEYEAHVAGWLLPRTRFAEHPECFRMNAAGVRTNDYNFCFSNPDTVKIVTERVRLLARGLYRNTNRYFLWLDDARASACQCARCRTLSASDQQLTVLNHLIKVLRAETPDARLAYLAYYDTMQSPEKVRPAPGIFLEYAPIKRVWNRAVSEQPDVVKPGELDALLAFFGKEDARVLEYWFDNSLFSNWQKPEKRFVANNAVFTADVAWYAARGFGEVASFACFLGPGYEQQWGQPDLSILQTIRR